MPLTTSNEPHPPGPGVGEVDLRPSRARWLLLAAACCTVVVAVGWPSLPLGIRNWDNEVKVQVAWNMLRGEGPVLTEPTPNDRLYVVHGVDGRTYGPYPLAASILHVLTIGAAKLDGEPKEGIPALLLLGLLSAVLVGWARRLGASPAGAAAGAMLVCLATALWPMAAHGQDVIIEAVALAVILSAAAGQQAWSWLLAGLAVGTAFATRLSAASLAVPAAVCLLAMKPRALRPAVVRWGAFALGCLPGLLLVLWYNDLRYGSPFTVHTTVSADSLDTLVVPWFSGRHWEAMAGLTVSPGKGLLWYGPPIIVAILAARPLGRRYPLALGAIAAHGLAGTVFFGKLAFWHGEWAWGPRYVAAAYLACAPLAWWITDRLAERSRGRAFACLAALGLASALQIVPVIGYPVEAQLEGVIIPRWRAGQLATAYPLDPPVPADNGLYFEPGASMIVSVHRRLATALVKDDSRALALKLVAVAALAPLGALLLVIMTHRLSREA